MPNTSRALVLTAGSLGDAILTLPALQELQKRASVTVAGTSSYHQLGAPALGVDQVIPLEPLLQSLHVGESLHPDFWKGFSEVFFFFKDGDPKVAARLSELPHLKLHQIKLHQPSETFENFLKKERWAGDFWLELVNPDHAPNSVKNARLVLSDAVNERGTYLVLSSGYHSPFIVHPGSGSRAKNAPLSFFRKAAQSVTSEVEKEVLVVWGEAEMSYLKEIQEAFKGLERVRLLPEPLPLPDLIALLTQACGYLGNDSGITHLASACGVKTFAVFNTTDSKIWGPQESIILAAMQTLYK